MIIEKDAEFQGHSEVAIYLSLPGAFDLLYLLFALLSLLVPSVLVKELMELMLKSWLMPAFSLPSGCSWFFIRQTQDS